MKTTIRRYSTLTLLLVGMLVLGPAPGHASPDGFETYEDWTASTIRSDRWLGGSDLARLCPTSAPRASSATGSASAVRGRSIRWRWSSGFET